MALFNIKAIHFLSLKILDTSSAATLFVTLLGALLVRHQFALGVLPRINYKSAGASIQNTQKSDKTYATWRVEILNTGLGSAIINGAEYFLELSGSKSNTKVYSLDQLINELEKIGLTRDCDYWIENITSGFTLSPKDNCFIFEIKILSIEKIKSLNMILFFQGQLGDRYRKEIFLTPRVNWDF